MKEISDNYWSLDELMGTYTGEAQTLLDYIDETISNPYVKPNLKLIRESLIRVLKNHNHQISNLEMFGLINWKQVIFLVPKFIVE